MRIARNPEARRRAVKKWKERHPEQHRAHQHAHYIRHRKTILARKAEYRAWLNSFKDQPCFDCRREYPSYVMQFDHRDPATKKFGIGSSATMRSRALVLAEIKKCDVVCANCHMERTWGKK